MKIALVLTVKNEERLLRDNLIYHKGIGIDRCYVYFDNTTDNGKNSIEDLPYVISSDSISPDKYKSVKSLEKFTKNAIEHHTARQCLNTFDAMRLSEEAGFDWLISLDADELICTSFNEVSNLNSFFETIPRSVNLVNFKVFELLQDRVSFNNVFKEATLFKTTFQFQNRFEKVLKNIYNPSIKKSQKFSFWYGQFLGKAAIRLHQNIIPHNVHRYKHSDETKLISIEKEGVLHYHAYDAKDFIKKFKNFSKHPTTFLSGAKVDALKLLLKFVVNNAGYSKEQLHEYFKNNLMFTQKEVKKLKKNTFLTFFKRKKPIVMSINSVQFFFSEQQNKK